MMLTNAWLRHCAPWYQILSYKTIILIWAHLLKMPPGQDAPLEDWFGILRRYVAAFTLPWPVDADFCAQWLESRVLRMVDPSDPEYYVVESCYTFRSLGINFNIPGDRNMAGLAVVTSREHIPLPALEHSVEQEVRLDAVDLYVCEFRRSVFLQVHHHLTHPCFKIVCLADRGEQRDSRWFEPPEDCHMKAAASNTLAPYYIFFRVLEQQFEISKREWVSLLDRIDTQIGLDVSLLLCLPKSQLLRSPSVI